MSDDFDTLATQLGNDIGTSTSARVIIPVCHIYLEHQMTIILKIKITSEEFKKIQDDRYFGFKKKLDRVREYIPNDDVNFNLDKINDIRNEFVHNFRPDLQTVTDMIFEIKQNLFNEKRNPLDVFLNVVISDIMPQLDAIVKNP